MPDANGHVTTGREADGAVAVIRKKMVKISFIFLCLDYMIYNVLVATDLHDWRGDKGRRACCGGVCKEIPKNMLIFWFIFLYLAYMLYNVLGATDLLRGVCDKINPKKIAKNFIYFSMPSLHVIQRTEPFTVGPIVMTEGDGPS